MPVIRRIHCTRCGVAVDPNSRCACGATHGESRRRQRHKQHGYGTARWQKLRRQAINAEPWCHECGSLEDLTGEHLNYPARTIHDVEVLCRSCNSSRARGA